MRYLVFAVSCMVLPLAGCDSGAEVAADGTISADALKTELATARKPNPGQYQSSIAIARFDVPGMPANEQAMIRQMMTSAAQVQRSYCLTAEQAARGSEDMFREMANSNGECQFTRFDISGDDVSGELSCSARGGAQAKMTMTGKMVDDRSTMTMVTAITDPSLPQGKAEMEMRVTSRRTGDCTPESRAAAEAAARAAAN